MEQMLDKIRDYLDEELLAIVISGPRRSQDIKKYRIRPILLKEKLSFQSERYTDTQVFHRNLSREDLLKDLAGILPDFRQVQLQSLKGDLTALISKKGKSSVKIRPKKKPDKPLPEDRKDRLAHDRRKRYLLPEGEPVPFLVDLGVMTEEGKIVRRRYDKYRQINRFLEFIEDILPALPRDRELTILDFGCGRSYLTFAMYYYLNVLKGYDIRIIGLDLKKDVIRNCARLAKSYGYEKLFFYEGAIEDFEGVSQVDMMVTLHACDTATDYALYKAVSLGAGVILSVPCCQHEVNGQLSARALAPITGYGILKERFAAMATDAIRAGLLEEAGYETQILEFIEMEHTPKNLLIRAVYKGRPSKDTGVEEFMKTFGVNPTLYTLLKRQGNAHER